MVTFGLLREVRDDFHRWEEFCQRLGLTKLLPQWTSIGKMTQLKCRGTTDKANDRSAGATRKSLKTVIRQSSRPRDQGRSEMIEGRAEEGAQATSRGTRRSRNPRRGPCHLRR
ncbi:hypothetical protein L226DRAFT_368344 [Lentinus tigrinus ALCF2SS1-7]|uniref:uncharacterized protein n=1 Tax=Lentinus tigrinus ALCF2SS1-7 TaxID=1328758 RepID=UPI001165EE7F|nr:hypothetical protein L226DRAFT_368344 [Lentinus tigrinus ALCF2SS1-7]